MNYLVLSKLYKLIDNEEDNEIMCENSKKITVNVESREELINVLEEHNYEYNPEEILMDSKNGSYTEEVLVTPEKTILTSDSTETEIYKVNFLIVKYCKNSAAIEIKDDGKYCEKCFVKKNKDLSFSRIENILRSKDETYGLSTSKKIEYILIKNGIRLTASEIYSLGDPWDLKTFTPRNSVYARIASLHKYGSIKKDGLKYYV